MFAARQQSPNPTSPTRPALSSALRTVTMRCLNSSREMPSPATSLLAVDAALDGVASSTESVIIKSSYGKCRRVGDRMTFRYVIPLKNCRSAILVSYTSSKHRRFDAEDADRLARALAAQCAAARAHRAAR